MTEKNKDELRRRLADAEPIEPIDLSELQRQLREATEEDA